MKRYNTYTVTIRQGYDGRIDHITVHDCVDTVQAISAVTREYKDITILDIE